MNLWPQFGVFFGGSTGMVKATASPSPHAKGAVTWSQLQGAWPPATGEGRRLGIVLRRIPVISAYAGVNTVLLSNWSCFVLLEQLACNRDWKYIIILLHYFHNHLLILLLSCSLWSTLFWQVLPTGGLMLQSCIQHKCTSSMFKYIVYGSCEVYCTL